MSAPLLRSGERVLIRPIGPADKQRMLDAFERLSPESRYRRFFSPTPRLLAEQLRYLTEVDHHWHEALGAVDARTDEVLGVARFMRSCDDPTVAEVAVAVVDDWQGRGLGAASASRADRSRAGGGVQRQRSGAGGQQAGARPTARARRHTRDRPHRGVVELLIDVPSEGIPELLRHTVRAAARGELQRDAR